MSDTTSQLEPEIKHEVLLLRPLSTCFEPTTLSKKYNLLKPWLSHLPLDAFLTTHAQSTRAIISSGPYCPLIDNSLIQLLPNLGIIAAATTGVDHIDLEACREKGVVVTNAGEVYSPDTADFAVGLLVDVLRRISGGEQFVRQRLWPVKGDFLLGSQMTPSTFSPNAVDFAVGLLVVDVLRQIFCGDWFVRQGLWPVKGDFLLGSQSS